MHQEEATPSSQPGQTEDNAEPSFFSVTAEVRYTSVTPELPDKGWHLPPTVSRLVSLVSLSAVLLTPLAGCSTGDESNLPCPVPTPNGNSTASCTTNGGSHFLWIPSRGGWVPSDDGEHPNPNAPGVGVNDGSSDSGSHSSSGSDSGGSHGGVGGEGGGHTGGGEGG